MPLVSALQPNLSNWEDGISMWCMYMAHLDRGEAKVFQTNNLMMTVLSGLNSVCDRSQASSAWLEANTTLYF
jgi:hypothetical protein